MKCDEQHLQSTTMLAHMLCRVERDCRWEAVMAHHLTDAANYESEKAKSSKR